MTKTLVLIDGHALAYRSFFAMPPLTAANGERTEVITRFMSDALKLAGGKNTRLAVAFDPPVPTFRHKEYSEYKAGRAKAPDELKSQIGRLRDLVDAMGWPRLEVDGYEADDAIATAARAAVARGFEVVIVTSDRDAYQLIGEGIGVLNSKNVLLKEQNIIDKYGVNVAQWLDFRAMIGDASDNIPGVKGVGEKTAAKLLAEHGNLDAILAAADAGELKPAGVQKKMSEGKADALRSRELSRLVDGVPLDLSFLDEMPEPNLERVQEILLQLGLQSITARAFAQAQSRQNSAPTAQFSAWPRREWRAPSRDAVWGAVLEEKNGPALAFAEDGHVHEAAAEKQVGLFAEQTEPASVPELLSAIPEHVTLNGADAKQLAAELLKQGRSAFVGHDPVLMAHVLSGAEASLSSAARVHLQQNFDEKNASAAERATLSAELLPILRDKLTAEPALGELYNGLEWPLSGILAKMEAAGVLIDGAHLRGLASAAEFELSRLESDIHAAAGKEFSVRSPKQLAEVLYDDLGLSKGKKTSTGQRSTAVASLEPLRDEHPIVPLILRYRELEKLRGTYFEPLPRLVDPRTGRLHTTFKQSTVATGRLSSIGPNLQNIPINGEGGRQMRQSFIAPEGHALVAADYSQLELRIMAHFAEDEAMIEAFAQGADIHRSTAARMFGLVESAVSVEQRRAAKTINFGVLYGMGAHRLAGELGISYAEAKDFIEQYFALFPRIEAAMRRIVQLGEEHGHVETLLGRRRAVLELRSSQHSVREAGRRLAFNMPIQGSAADIVKMAMLRLEKPLEALGARMLLQVHDELLVETPSETASEVAILMKEIMEGSSEMRLGERSVRLLVPLQVGVGVGQNWDEAK